MKSFAFLALSCAVLGAGILSQANAGVPQTAKSYKNDVAPILKSYCLSCHTGSSAKAGLDLSTYKGLTAKREKATIVAGKAEKSALIQAVKGSGEVKKMPPGRRTVKAAEIEVLSAWINEGAKDN